jgi:hypothetical protein
MIRNRIDRALQCWPEKYSSEYGVWANGEESVSQPVTWWDWNKGEISRFSRYRVEVDNILRDYVHEQTQS